MSHPFEMWSDRIASAETDESRRALLTEAAVWRARNLSDILAVRRATFAICRLHVLLHERDRAVSEARQLLSLCQTAPAASAEEISAASGYLESLGERAPKLLTRPARTAPGVTNRDRNRERPAATRPTRDRERGDRERAPTEGRSARTSGRLERNEAVAEARRLAASGDFAGSARVLKSMDGAGVGALRVYVELSIALASSEPLEAARAVCTELGRMAGVNARGRESAPDLDDPLSSLLGVSIPNKRAARIRLIEQFAAEHPERMDELAAAALRNHVAATGPGVPGPWLVGVVGRALASGQAVETRSVIRELRERGAVVVAAYDEWPFERLVRLVSRLVERGTEVGSLRRGVLAGGEPDDRKLWTLRFGIGAQEAMIAVAAHATEAYSAEKARELADRLKALCGRTLLVATGSGNASLREAAEAAGLSVRDTDGDDDALLEIVTTADVPEASSASAVLSPARLADVLAAEPFSHDDLVAVLRSFRRPDRALRLVQRLDLDDVRTAAVLSSVHEATEADRTLPEGTTLAVRAAATGPLTRALLVNGGAVAARYGGTGIDVVVELATVLASAGWDVHRVLRGPTRRETTQQPALDTLSPAMSGLWRLLVRKGDRRGEVWFLADLPIEGRAGVPLLLKEPWQRVVVLPLDPELLAWYRGLAAGEALGWTGAEASDLLRATDAFEVSTAPAHDDGESATAPG